MAVEKKLDCVILGLLNHEDLTGYEIKKRMDTVLSYFWSASYGSIYPTLGNLVERGLAVKRDGADCGRSKYIYTITKEGRVYLKQWLTIPAERDELHYETLLKLFFGSEAGPAQGIEHITAFKQKIEKELFQLRGMQQQLEGILDVDTAHKYYLLTARFGVKAYQSFLEWCEEAEELLKEDQTTNG